MDVKELNVLISKSNHIVCLSGRGMSYDCGYPAYWTQDYSYYFENKYKKSLDEVFHIGFYSTRNKEFFSIFKEEMLQYKCKPSLAFYKLSSLEKEGKLKAIITKGIFGLSKRAGCKNVIDLYGNIYENFCPKCGQKYSSKYIMQSKGIPKCLECQSPIRPEIKMFGEIIDNNKLTKAHDAIATADLLLILDTGFNDEFSDYLCHYHGSKSVLIKEHPHESDRKANHIIYDKARNVLSKIKEDEKLHIMYDNLDVVNK
ncbi:Sir2 family NAD-dependent protein deacetylase [Candidatus Galacturonibacter soehngenii]|uniref:protein acetyllysine N-acetyltransferase n=1 Tax=Candidatus Galacturonatibacter soehngenii TaxID=2307010 RepID=A0A7V7QLI9_9FIRM|nr:Sir2 family NAD-dependent protein deacetylase [Candidatus Galacturonibacter soehngenii]KAB1439392.1 NAD-dependent deacetylase [Candidatus Galacturonibacter soehngenii]